MNITEKVAYLKGLAEGMKLDTESKEGKILSAMIDILDDMALEMQDLRDEQYEIEEGLDAVSDDLSDVESFIYEAFDEDDEDEDDEEENEPVYETTCPNCEEAIYFDEDILEDGFVECPNCGEKLEFDLSGLDEGGFCCDGGCCGDKE